MIIFNGIEPIENATDEKCQEVWNDHENFEIRAVIRVIDNGRCMRLSQYLAEITENPEFEL